MRHVILCIASYRSLFSFLYINTTNFTSSMLLGVFLISESYFLPQVPARSLICWAIVSLVCSLILENTEAQNCMHATERKLVYFCNFRKQSARACIRDPMALCRFWQKVQKPGRIKETRRATTKTSLASIQYLYREYLVSLSIISSAWDGASGGSGFQTETILRLGVGHQQILTSCQ